MKRSLLLNTLKLAVMGLLFSFAANCGDESNNDDNTMPFNDASTDVDYQGETIGGGIPNDVPEGVLDDSDSDTDIPFEANESCCNSDMSMTDNEPENTIGFLEGTFLYDGESLLLTRAEGKWSIEFCLPMVGSYLYWFEFIIQGDSNSDASTVIRRALPGGETMEDADGFSVNVHYPTEECP